MEKNVTYEVCPYCGEEVELNAELSVQTCPKCGKRIVACTMCDMVSEVEGCCINCCLCYKAEKENAESDKKETVISVSEVVYGRDDLLSVAEQIVYEMGFGDGEELCEHLAKTAFEYLYSRVYKNKE